jgi:predicted glycosyltransferase
VTEKILIDIVHPAHVHFFKEFIKKFQNNGGEVLITSRRKDIATDLLDKLNITHTPISTCGKGKLGLLRELLFRNLRLIRIAIKFKPDIFMGIAGFSIAFVSKLFGKPALVFTDTEHASVSNKITFPFASKIITPSCYRNNIGKKQIRYNGYHELAYLHPNYFNPDRSILKYLGVKDNEKFVIMRFVGWGAAHDVGYSGLSLEMKTKAVEKFSQYAKVFITSEKEIPAQLEKYRIEIPIEKIHDALYYATLLYTEGATMASEGAILGTPAIYVNGLELGYINELDSLYGSVFKYSESPKDQERSINKGIELLKTKGIKEVWNSKRQKILSDKIDVTKWMFKLVTSKLQNS